MGNKFYELLGSSIQEARKERNLTQQDVADRLKVSRSRVANWETGKRTISTDDLFRLADVFLMDVNDLIKEARKSLYK